MTGAVAEGAVGASVLDGDRAPVIVEEDDESAELEALQAWLKDRGLRSGIAAFALLALDGGREEAVLDLAWPDGLRYGEERLALLLNEPSHVLDAAGKHGYRFFTSTADMQDYVEREVLVAQS